ncbi:endonuclease domain-containing protein [[Actinomadura] parvosata]|uniref:endonuclease domain-containing protein n=1 Tax=[Actinomadura] parvosata TaxID=1955412 RepID=UPI00406C8552
MRECVPEVRFENGRVVTTPEGVALAWLPLRGQVVAKLPAMSGNRRWLHKTVGVRSPRLDDRKYWRLPRTCSTKLTIAAIDRFGYIVLVRDMSQLTRCNRKCQEAEGLECQCSCRGAHHGQNTSDWFERYGDVLVAELGEITQTVVLYGAKGDDAAAVFYDGELQGQRYRVDRGGRRGWPRATRFWCAACLTARARVWDHCHTHGFVRAPLCNTCNTRYWSGWDPQYGRATPTRNLDTSYYGWCPLNGVQGQWECST